MRVIVMVKADQHSEAGEMPSEALITAMTEYNEALVEAGIMVSGEGLHPSSRGVRIHFDGERRDVVKGPFANPSELVAGFWIWEVKSMEEAIDWAKRCPNPQLGPSDLEIRPIFTDADFGDALTPELQAREDALRRSLADRE